MAVRTAAYGGDGKDAGIGQGARAAVVAARESEVGAAEA